jgi:transcriptional regulator with XRE-family HTH domain
MPDDRTSMIGPVGRTVIANIEQLRKTRGLSLRDLAAKLAAIGRPIGDTVLHRQSAGKRRIDADDLVAFAIALGVAPDSLLFPRDVGWDDMIELTPEVEQRAYAVWSWAQLIAYLPAEPVPVAAEASPGEDREAHERQVDFEKHARPRGGEIERDPAHEGLRDAAGRVRTSLQDFANPASWDRQRDWMIRGLRLAAIQMEEMIARGDREAERQGGGPYDTGSAIRQIQEAAGQVRAPFVDYAPGTAERIRDEARGHYANPREAAGATRTVLDPFGKRED